MTAPDMHTLAAAMAPWLPSRRWFQGKARDTAGVEILDHATIDLPGDGQVLVAVVGVAYADGGHDRYLVPLVASPDGELAAGQHRWADALDDADAVRALARLATEESTVSTAQGGVLAGRPVTGERPPDDAGVRRLGVEQTNSSVVLGDAWILKVLRRLEAGPHPDVEVTAALTAAGFAHVPAQHGSWVLRQSDGSETALSVLADFLAGAHEGWDLATAETRRLAAGEEVSEDELLASFDPLGEAVAGLHNTLSDAMGWRDATREDAAAWSQAMLDQLDGVLALAGQRAPELTADVRGVADELRAAFHELGGLADAGRVTRIHGDLHLGQVLRETDGTWKLLDFEGEPARPLEERGAPSSPLRDVAGMLRSFDYAAAAATGAGAGSEPALGADPGGGTTSPGDPVVDQWRDTARRRFLAGYIRHAGGLLPGARASEALLAAFELDKAVYELGYELANRPAWVSIPVGGILRTLDARKASRQ